MDLHGEEEEGMTRLISQVGLLEDVEDLVRLPAAVRESNQLCALNIGRHCPVEKVSYIRRLVRETFGKDAVRLRDLNRIASAKLAGARAALGSVGVKVGELEKSNADLRNQIDEAAQAAQSQVDALQREVAELKLEMETKTSAVTQAELAKAAVEQKLARLEAQLAAQTTTIDDLQLKLGAGGEKAGSSSATRVSKDGYKPVGFTVGLIGAALFVCAAGVYFWKLRTTDLNPPTSGN